MGISVLYIEAWCALLRRASKTRMRRWTASAEGFQEEERDKQHDNGAVTRNGDLSMGSAFVRPEGSSDGRKDTHCGELGAYYVVG